MTFSAAGAGAAAGALVGALEGAGAGAGADRAGAGRSLLHEVDHLRRRRRRPDRHE